MCSIGRVETSATRIPEIAIIAVRDKRPLLNALKRVGLVYPENSNAQTLLLKSPSSSSGFSGSKNDQYAVDCKTSWEKAGSCSLIFAPGLHGTDSSSPGHSHRYQPLRTTVPASSRLLAPHNNSDGSVPALVLHGQPHLFSFLGVRLPFFQGTDLRAFFARSKSPGAVLSMYVFYSNYYFLLLAE